MNTSKIVNIPIIPVFFSMGARESTQICFNQGLYFLQIKAAHKIKGKVTRICETFLVEMKGLLVVYFI